MLKIKVDILLNMCLASEYYAFESLYLLEFSAIKSCCYLYMLISGLAM